MRDSENRRPVFGYKFYAALWTAVAIGVALVEPIARVIENWTPN